MRPAVVVACSRQSRLAGEVGSEDGFLAGQPRAPRRRAARAVRGRARQAGPRFPDGAAGRIELDGCRAAARLRVVGRPRGKQCPAAHLVVAHQSQQTAAGRKRRHAVVHFGRRRPVGQRVAGPAQRQVAEARGQLQQRQSGRLVAHRLERTVAHVGRQRCAGGRLAALCLDTAGQRMKRRRAERRTGNRKEPAPVQTGSHVAHAAV